MAGSDCGFGTGAGMAVVDPQITWAKFQAMRDGAALATQQLRKPVAAGAR
jgi:5-methyltetrahydropteroyltriglutamate--homocysteine methyltransferase